MRALRSLPSALLLALALGGCSWSAFDDLGGEMWVDAVGGADGVSPHDFVGVAAPGTTTQNAVFVALGRSTDSVGAYNYDPDGARATTGVEIRAGALQFGPLSPDVVTAGDPYSNIVGVAAVTGAVNDGDTKVASFEADNIQNAAATNDFNNAGVLDGPIQATGMAYARTDDDGVGTTTTDVVLARGAQIALVSDYASSTGQSLAGCLGATANDLVLSVGAGRFDQTVGDDDDELVAVINNLAGTAPQIVIFNGSAITATFTGDPSTLNTCFDDGVAARATLARIDGPAADPSFGTRMVVGDFDGDGDPDLAVSSPDTSKVTAYINQGGLTFTEVNVPAPVEATAFGSSLAAGDLDGTAGDELVVGAPQSNLDGAVHGGLVAIYSFDGTSFTDTPVLLHDAQPETEQRMGVAAAVVPWGTSGKRVLVVSGEHELFTYFKTSLYDDVRNQ